MEDILISEINKFSMSKKIAFILIILIGYTNSLSAQCPDRELLWKRIALLRDSIKSTPDQQLDELVPYLDKIRECKKPNDSTYALLLQRVGWLYALKKDYIKGIGFLKQSINVINYGSIVMKGDRSLLPRNYNNLRICYEFLKQPVAARACLDSCIVIGLRLKSAHSIVVSLLSTRSNYFFDTGDYYRALEGAELGEQLVRENQQIVDYAAYYISSFPVLKMNSLVFLKKYGELEKLIIDLIAENKSKGNESSLGALYALYARVTEEKGDIKGALKLYEQAYNYNDKIKNLNACAEVLNNIGFNLYFRMLQQNDVALKYYYQALSDANSREKVNILTNIANAYVAKNNFDSAFIFYQRAFDQIKQGISEQDIVNNIDTLLNNNIIQYISGLFLDKADAYFAQYKKKNKAEALSMAIRAYRLSDQLFNAIRRSQSEIQSKLFWRVNNKRLYDHAIEASYLAGSPENAFYFFERSRAVLLNDQLNEQYLVRPTEMMALAQVKRNIHALEVEQKSLNKSVERTAEIQKELFSNRQDHDKLLATIKSTNPLYYQGFFDTSMISIADVQKRILTGNSALIELFAGDSAVYSLVISSDFVRFNKIDKQDYDRLSNLFITYTSNFRLQNANFKNYNKISNQLYHLLFGNTPLVPTRIIVSPDGHFFPFEALVTSVSNNGPKYFLEDHAVTYTYSARYLLNQFSEADPTFKNFLGLAPLRYPYNPALPDLTGSDKSLIEIDDYFSNSDKLVATKASRYNFMHCYSDYKIVQLYTHASDTSSRGEPVIWFSDSVLYLSDLITEKRPLTRLIVLSACQTATGRLYKGEGVFSFNRGFAALGIPSAITNLWLVDSKSTYEITKLFYKYLKDGEPTDISLQKAKLEFIKMNPEALPYHWAAPILTGKAEVIELKESVNWTWIILGIFILSILLFVWIKRMRSARLSAQIKGFNAVS